MKKQAYLLLTHEKNDDIEMEFQKISKATASTGDSYLLFHSKESGAISSRVSDKLYRFNNEYLKSLSYPMYQPTMTPGSTHFPLLCFYRDFPCYDYYWVVEYDVRFTGDWKRFFNYFSITTEDLLTCHIRRYRDEPWWHWWTSLNHPAEEIPLNERLRSFNVVYRISNRALAHIERMHCLGWSGHYETLLPTLLHRDGFQLRDFGGLGAFVNKRDKNRFYIESRRKDKGGRQKWGTVRWRPCFAKAGWRWNKLYHPVKSIGEAGDGNA